MRRCLILVRFLKQFFLILNSISIFFRDDVITTINTSTSTTRSTAEVKNGWSYTPNLPYVFMAWCLVKHRDKFTLSSSLEKH
jgi:hypothetical protein